VSYFVGSFSLLVFVIFLFVGSLDLVDLGLGEIGSLGLNAGLCLAFFIQHSAMIRRSFRRWSEQRISTDFHGALYTIVSGVFLLTLVVLWQKSSHTPASAQGVLRWLLRAVFLLSIIGFYWGIRALGKFDAYGIGPILRYLRGAAPRKPMPFVVRGPYRWVRHPLYFFVLLMIWSCPDLTADRLLFNILWTIWIIIGTVLEERDLVEDFGSAYRDYQREVPVLIPWRLPRLKRVRNTV